MVAVAATTGAVMYPWPAAVNAADVTAAPVRAGVKVPVIPVAGTGIAAGTSDGL